MSLDIPPDNSPDLVLKLIFGSKRVGSIIGRGGEVIKYFRAESCARINVSDGSSQQTERVVTVTGTQKMIVKAIELICYKLEDDNEGLNLSTGIPRPPITLRLILPTSQCGSVIGKGGSNITEIREITGASIIVASGTLPDSTEREIVVVGTGQSITDSVYHICCAMLERPLKGLTIPYRPKSRPIGGPIIIVGGQAYTIHGDYAIPASSNVTALSHHFAALSRGGSEFPALAVDDSVNVPICSIKPVPTESELPVKNEDAINRKSKPINHQLIGIELEKKEKYQAALQEYFDGKHFSDVIRLVTHYARTMKLEWLLKFFTWLSSDMVLQCIGAMLHDDIARNLNVCVKVAISLRDRVTQSAFIEIFESNECYEGLFLYLSSMVDLSEDPEVHYSYIVAASKTSRLNELERICRESNYYNPLKVMDFLMKANLTDHLPLILVCDRFDYVYDLMRYLYGNSLQQEIEVFVQQVNPSRLPSVVGCLLDMDCAAKFVESLILSVRGQFSTEDLVEEVEKRNRLKVLLPWLEKKSAEMSIIYQTWNKIQRENQAQGVIRTLPTCDYFFFGQVEQQ